MRTIRFEYRTHKSVGTSPFAEADAWQRLGEALARHLSHELADNDYRLMRAMKDQATDFYTKETVWSITLEIGGESSQETLARTRDYCDQATDTTDSRRRRTRVAQQHTTIVVPPSGEILPQDAPIAGRKILIDSK